MLTRVLGTQGAHGASHRLCSQGLGQRLGTPEGQSGSSGHGVGTRPGTLLSLCSVQDVTQRTAKPRVHSAQQGPWARERSTLTRCYNVTQRTVRRYRSVT